MPDDHNNNVSSPAFRLDKASLPKQQQQQQQKQQRPYSPSPPTVDTTTAAPIIPSSSSSSSPHQTSILPSPASPHSPVVVATSPTSTAPEKTVAILATLKQLEARAKDFNDLARQVNAEERACLAELSKVRKSLKAITISKSDAKKKKNAKRKSSSLSASSDKVNGTPNGSNEDIVAAPAGSGAEGQGQVEGDNDDDDERPPDEGVMESIERKLRHLEFQFPKPAHIILRLALGSHAPVSLKPLQLRLAYKHEYEVFKLRFTLIFMFLSTCALLVTSSRLLDAVFGFTYLYYYATCVLREHILLVNGSRIRTWWFVHHYISIALAGVVLIWPASPLYHSFRTHFFAFSLYISAMQFLQYRYQRSRLYVLVALDRARPMDTVSGEGGFFAANGEREFRLLVPFLGVGQVWQAWNAALLLRPWWDWWWAVNEEIIRSSGRGSDGGAYYFHTWKELLARSSWAAGGSGAGSVEWQGTVAGALFAALAVGNSVATVRTWRAKTSLRKGTTGASGAASHRNSGSGLPASPTNGHSHAL
ncbi:hypothetical protein HDU87_003073 [Geranomyces variabilis]|uniref:Uncharacterized protein n=1 Tax=Geranomyces variabilis TaxID=109894 RepID=A0AAD5XND5_9FUNG|nr:hypothetical protein HDU87_003073 [Geranomyces variabilis]